MRVCVKPQICLCVYVLVQFPVLESIKYILQKKSRVTVSSQQAHQHKNTDIHKAITGFLISDPVMSESTSGRVFASFRSFIAESEQLKEQWVNAMRNAIGEALSNSEVAERIWAEPSNSLCADCGAPKPEWAAINLCVVVCKRCAGLCVCVCVDLDLCSMGIFSDIAVRMFFYLFIFYCVLL